MTGQKEKKKKKAINGKITFKLRAVSSGHLLTTSPVSTPNVGGDMLEKTGASSHPLPAFALPNHHQTNISGSSSFSIPKA